MRNLSLKTKLVAAISSLVLASAALISLTGYLALRGDIVRKTQARLAFEAKENLDGLDRIVAQQINVVRLLAKLKAFASALQFDIYDEAHSLCVTWAAGNRDISSVVLLDNKGQVKASSGSYGVWQPFEAVPLTPLGQGKDWHFYDVHWDATQKRNVYTVAARVRDQTDVGFLVVDFSWDDLVRVFAQRWGKGTDTQLAHYLLLSQRGLVTATSDKSLAPQVFRSNAGNSNLPSVRAVMAGRAGGGVERDLLGRMVICGYASASGLGDWPGAGWRLIASEDMAAALGVIRKIGMQVLANTVVLACAGFLLAWLIVFRSIAAPIKDLMGLFRRVAEGDLTGDVTAGSQDEFGQLKEAAVTMVRNLRTLVTHITETSGEVASAVADIGAIAEEVSAGSTRQSLAAGGTLEAITRIALSGKGVAETAAALVVTVEETCSTAAELSASIEQISASTEGLSNSAAQTGTSIAQMTRSIRELAAMANIQTQSVGDTGSAIAQIADSVRSVVCIVQEADSIARRNAQEGEAGGEAVRRATQAMETMRSVIEATVSAIRKLEIRSAEVGKIVRFIDGVSSQTNLLALNASIIAAQAGEHGKPFGVVADNVRDLAHRTKTAALEIGKAIAKITDETKEAVLLADNTLKEAREGESLSRIAGDAISSILEGAARTADLLSDIAAACGKQGDLASRVVGAMTQLSETTARLRLAASEQASASDHIGEAVENVTSITAQVDAATREQAAATTEIARTMDSMSEMTNRVAHSSEAQSESSDQVVDAMTQVRDMAARNLNATKRLAKAAQTLTAQGEKMVSLVGQFRI